MSITEVSERWNLSLTSLRYPLTFSLFSKIKSKIFKSRKCKLNKKKNDEKFFLLSYFFFDDEKIL